MVGLLLSAVLVGCASGDDAADNGAGEEAGPPAAVEGARSGPEPEGAATSAVALGSCVPLPEALRRCVTATCGSRHPIVPDFTIRHEVRGRDDGGTCRYTQSMPSDMRMVCAFDDASAARYADELEATLVGARDSIRVAFGGGEPGENPTGGKCVVLDTGGDTVGVV